VRKHLYTKEKHLKIGIICHNNCGGSSKVAVDLGSELSSRGHRIHIFTREPAFFSPQSDSGIIPHTVLPDSLCKSPLSSPLTDWSSHETESLVQLVLHVFRRDGLDVLHIHYAVPFAFIVQSIKARLGEKAPVCIATLHGTDVSIFGHDPVLRTALVHALQDFDALTTVSQSHAGLAKDVLHLNSKFIVIPNFVTSDHFLPKRTAFNHRKPRILHVSNFKALKDPLGVVRIFALIRRKIDAELWLVGDGEEMEKVKNALASNGISGDVRYFGLRRDTTFHYLNSDLLLMPSKSESFCLAALEAMACGTPVLASRIGGLPEVVVDGKTGFLFPLGDYEVAAETAVRILSNTELKMSLGHRAREHARMFNHRRIVGLYENLYREVMENT